MEAVYTYKSNWWGYIGKRVLIAVIAFVVISLVVFVPIKEAEWNESESPFLISSSTIDEQLIKEYNEPLIISYFRWMGGFFTGDLGESLLGNSHYLE